jgi:hypothetical protein
VGAIEPAPKDERACVQLQSETIKISESRFGSQNLRSLIGRSRSPKESRGVAS